MNSYQRVIAALNHQEPDQIPFGIVEGFVTGISREAYRRLAVHYLGMGPEEVPMVFYDTKQQLPVIDERILREIGADFRGLVPNIGRKNAVPTMHGDGSQTFSDEWGLVYQMKEGGSLFDVVYMPLEDKNEVKDLDEFKWPDPEDPALFEGLAAEARRHSANGFPVILEDLFQGIFEMSWSSLRGGTFFYDLYDRPEYVHELLERLTDIRIRFYRAAGEHLKGLVQCVRYGDDLASQKSPFISPQMYAEFLKPRYERIFQAQKEAFTGSSDDFFVFFHCDGAINPLMPNFLELEVDILNPLQRVPSVDIADLKRRYGGELSFWGGIDTQQILNKGSPQKVREHVRSTIECLKEGGGFVFSPSHNVQRDVPLDNFLAMLDQFRELRNY